MARPKDVRMANFRRRRAQLNKELLRAEKEGRLVQVLNEMELEARKQAAKKDLRRTAP